MNQFILIDSASNEVVNWIINGLLNEGAVVERVQNIEDATKSMDTRIDIIVMVLHEVKQQMKNFIELCTIKNYKLQFIKVSLPQ